MSDEKNNNRVSLPAEMAAEYRNPKWGAKQLKGISLFRKFTDAELGQIYALGEILSIKPKSYAVIEGEPTRGLYIILSGTVSVYKNDPLTGAMRRIAFLDAGENFGELSLFDTAPRSATVAAESVVHMFALDADVFEKYLNKTGNDAKLRFYKSCAEELVGRFRKLNGDYIAAQQLLWKHALKLETDKGGEEGKTSIQKTA